MSFAELFSEALDTEVVSGLLEYYREPTLWRARVLLGALGIAVPYDALAMVAKSARRWARAARRGGGRRGRRSVAPVVPDFFAIHRCIDMIHDLAQGRVPGPVLDSVLSQAPGMPAEVADEIRAIARTQPPGAIHRALLGLAERLGNLTPADRAEVDLVPSARAAVLRADYAFARLVAEWLQRPKLEIVLDNVFREPIPPPKRLRGDSAALAALNTPEAARTLALCAFLQLVLGGWDARLLPPRGTAGSAGSAGASLPIAVREVRFLIGTFQTLDVGGYEKFLKRWVHALRAEAAHFYTLSEANFTYETISVADAAAAGVAGAASGTGSAALSLTETGVHARGLFVPYRLSERLRRAEKERAIAAAATIRGAPDFLAIYRDYFQTAYPKQWLRDLYGDYGALAPRDRARRDVRDFMAAVFDVNALRDALRADVALARGAVFITGDHLAFAYYAKRAEALGAPRDGFSLEAGGIGDLNARFYLPPRSAAPSASEASASQGI